MAENYYDDGPSDSGAMNEAKPTPKDDESEMDGDATTIIPKSVTGGKTFEVGDEIVLEVVAVMEDELQVRYASEKGSKDEESKEGESKEPSMEMATKTNNDSSSYMD